MRYVIGFVKSMILVVLIVGSIYQTGKLWFEDISDRNFFYDSISDSSSTVADAVGQTKDFIVPEQVGVYIGAPDIEYTVIGYGATSYSGIVDASETVVKKVLEKGTYVGVLDDNNELWDDQHIVIILPFALTSSELASGFGISDNLAKKIDKVEAFVIVPAGEGDRSLHLYFESSMSEEIHHFQINKDTVLIQDEALYSYLNNIIEGENNPAYISTRKNNLPLYERTLLLPMVSRDIRYHSSLYWDVPFIKNGDSVDEEAVRQFVRGFFDNPDVMSKISYEDEVRFTAGNKIVRYTNEGELDYTTNSAAKGKPELSDAIAIAEKFLSGSAKIASFEYHLSGYELGAEDVTIYYSFGYNGFPIVMDLESRDYYRQPYSVSIKVRGSEVVNFHSIIRQIPDLLPQFESFDMPYKTALDLLLEEIGELSNPITDMYLGYKWDEAASEMKLHWIVEVNDEIYFVEVGGN